MLKPILAMIVVVRFQVPQLSNFWCEAALFPLTDHTKTGYYKLHQDLQAHPAVQAKAPPSTQQQLNITLGLYPVDILGLEPSQQVMSMSCYISLLWTDPALRWNPNDYGSTWYTLVPPTQVWTPLLSVINEVHDKEIVANEKASLLLWANGVMMLTVSKTLKTSCTMDLTYFPFDTQICGIIFSILPPTLNVTVKSENHPWNNFLDVHSAAGEWTLIKNTWVVNRSQSGSANMKYVKLDVVLKRKYTFYIFSILGPMILVFAMNSLVFLIPSQSGEKISFLISLFITNAVFSSYINRVMPCGFEDNIPYIIIALLVMWVFSVVCFLATLFVLHQFHKKQRHGSKDTKSKQPECSGSNSTAHDTATVSTCEHSTSTYIRQMAVENQQFCTKSTPSNSAKASFWQQLFN